MTPPSTQALPPGQHELASFPRFGMWMFARYRPQQPAPGTLHLRGDVQRELTLPSILDGLPRREQISDFHCVTTWSRRSVHWGGVLFADFYRQVIQAQAGPHPDTRFVVMRGQDGYRSCLLLEDLLQPDVLLADQLDGQPLTAEHGAPLRLVAPAQYGYKSVKHLTRIELRVADPGFRPAGFAFMDHPRARVALEERGRWVPAWLLRQLYRPLVAPTVKRFARDWPTQPPS